MFSQASSKSTSTASEVKSWKQAFTSSLLTLGEEKVAPADSNNNTDASNRSIANSTLSGGLSRQQYSTNPKMKQHQHQHSRPSKDSVSVLTCDDDDNGLDDFENDDDHVDDHHDHNLHPALASNELLTQKEEELNQLMELQALQAQALEETRSELTNLKMEFTQQERQWAMSIEDLQYQKTILQERLGVMQDDVNNPELIEQLTKLIKEEAPEGLLKNDTPKEVEHNDDEIENGEDDVESKATPVVGTVTSGFRSVWGSRTRSQPPPPDAETQQKIKALQDYATVLQLRLTEAMHKVTIMSNQITTMEQAHEDHVSKVIHSIRESEMERIQIQIESDEKYQTLLHEKKMAEQALSAKLKTATDKLTRLEERVQELQDAALSSAKVGADECKRFQQEKDHLIQTYNHDVEFLRIQIEKSEEKFQALQHEKQITEQQLLSKLETKTVKLCQLEERVEDLQDAATTNAKLAADDSKRFQEEKAHLVQNHDHEVGLLRAEVEKLNNRNDALERHVERLAAGGAESNVETNGNDFWEGEFPSWSSRDLKSRPVDAPVSDRKKSSRRHRHRKSSEPLSP
jgi:hypothetical protein